MAKTKEIKTDGLVRMVVQQSTFNKEKKTIEVTFVSETPTRMYNWDIGEFDEVLSCDPKSVRMDRAKVGLPVFDSHYPRTAMAQLGIATDIRFEKGVGVATITLGARADEALISDIENGIIKGISVGYRVYMYDGKIEKDKTPQLRATDWEPMEISFAPVQADPKSKIRSESSDSINTIINLNSQEMTIAEIRAKASDEQKARLDAVVLIARAAGLSDDKAVEMYESEKTVEVIRSENPGKQEPPKSVENPVDVNKVREEATKELKARLDGILLSTRAAKIEDSKAIEYFESKKTIDEIRQEIIEKYVATDPKVITHNPDVNMGKEAIEKKREAAEQAVLHRIAPQVFDIEKVGGAREFRGMTIHEVANALHFERTGKAVLSRFEMADMIFGGQRTHGTSDFPLLLENIMYKALRADYKFAPEYWSMIARQTSVSDFRKKNLYQVDSVNGMKEIKEGGEIQYTSLVEAKQTISVKEYAEGIKFTRQAYINDDMSAFSLIPSRFVLDWETLKGDIVWGLIMNNVTMDDAKALFHADHKNLLTGAGSALAEAGLEAADLAMSTQKGLDEKKLIRVMPKYLIVPNALKVTSKKLMTGITATKTGDVNVFNGAYETIVEPRLTAAKAWYLAADPSMTEGLYYAYLDGDGPGLRSYREEDFDSASIKFAVRGTFGANAIDYRGWVKNAGE